MFLDTFLPWYHPTSYFILYLCSYNTRSSDMARIYQPYLEEGVLCYSMAPSECIDTGKTWPVYTVQLHALGRRACIGIHMA